MTLFVDSRAGSHELVKPLLKLGLPVEETLLDSADVMFEGRGFAGEPILVGIEYKKLGELVQALRTERLQGHQLLKMRGADTPDSPPLYPFAYLLIEGSVHVDAKGYLTRASKFGRPPQRVGGSMTENELDKRIATIHRCGGLVPVWSDCQRRTCAIIAAWYRTFTDRSLDEHTSHVACYRPPSLVPLSEFRVFIQSIDGISFKTSKAIETYFGGSEARIRDAVNAPYKVWAAIEGIGPKRAAQIVEALGS